MANWKLTLSFVFFVGGLLTFMASGCGSSIPSAVQAQAAKPARLEYCRLNVHSYGNGASAELQLPTTTIKTQSIKELCAELSKEPAADNNTTAVVNALAAQGWELVTHSVVINAGSGNINEQAWTFKRART